MNYDDKIEEAQFAASLLLLVVGLKCFNFYSDQGCTVHDCLFREGFTVVLGCPVLKKYFALIRVGRCFSPASDLVPQDRQGSGP